MSAVSLIHRYNRLNGNSISLEKLKEFRKDIQTHVDSVGHGPFMPDLKGILSRVTNLIKRMSDQGYQVVERLELVPIDVNQIDVKKPQPPPVKKQKAKAKAKAKFKPKARGKKPKPVEVDKSLLYGIEHLQNDKDYQGKALGEVGSTAYKVITDRILSLMQSDGLIWRKPWNANHQGKGSHAHNYVTKHYYRGSNFYLNYLLMAKFEQPFFMTFNQINAKGGQVKKGEKGFPVVYFKYLYKNLKSGNLVDEREAVANGKVKPGYNRFPALFYYLVWNVEQCEGITVKKFAPVKVSEKQKIESCEQIVQGMPKRPPIRNVPGDSAYYQPATDSITLPLMEQFKKEQEYYCTLFHELVHSTGAKNRLDRTFGSKGTKAYAFEELIAELGASYLCGESGILYFTMKNSAAYIQGWSKRLREEMTADPKFFLKAAAAAEKASEFILSRAEQKAKKVVEREPLKREKKLKPVKVAKQVTAKQVPEKKIEVKKSLGFISADQTPATPANTFVLPGPMAMLGQLQRFKLQIVIPGETHSSKSQLGMQIANAFAAMGDEVAWIDWEQGGMDSKDTQLSIQRNTDQANRKRIHVYGNIPRTLEAVKKLASEYKVIALDSGTKLKGQRDNAWIDDLREEHPQVVWIIMMQQNATGGTRGGSAAEFDSPVVLKTYRPDHADFKKNYANVFKNRGNRTGFNYLINLKQLS